MLNEKRKLQNNTISWFQFWLKNSMFSWSWYICKANRNTIYQNANWESLGRTSASDFYFLVYILLSFFPPSFLSTINMHYICSWASWKNKLYIPFNFLPHILTEWKKDHLTKLYRMALKHFQCSHAPDPSTNPVNLLLKIYQKPTTSHYLHCFYHPHPVISCVVHTSFLN